MQDWDVPDPQKCQGYRCIGCGAQMQPKSLMLPIPTRGQDKFCSSFAVLLKGDAW